MGRFSLWVCWAALSAFACATGVSTVRPPEQSPESAPRAEVTEAEKPAPQAGLSSRLPEDRRKVVDLARELLGKTKIQLAGRRYPNDCTGLVRALFDRLGMNLLAEARRGDNGVGAIYRYAEAHGRLYTGGRPVPGDLVFFRDTYDRRAMDGLTHVGIVDDYDEDGTVWIIHRVRRGVVRYRMNLRQPDQRLDPQSGKLLNDYLRISRPGHRDVLTGQLFAAFATVLPTSDSQSRTRNVSLREAPAPRALQTGQLLGRATFSSANYNHR